MDPIPLECLRGISGIDEFAAPATSIGSFRVQTGGCTGFRITAGGQSIAYLPDHESYRIATQSSDPAIAAKAQDAETELLQFLEGCDLMIPDAQYGRAEHADHIDWGHGGIDDSVGLALRAGVELLILFHHDPNHDDAEIDTMLAEARWQVIEADARLRVEAAREREEIFPALRPKELAA